MQLESLRKHFTGSRFDQPLPVETLPRDAQEARPPARSDAARPSLNSSPTSKVEKNPVGSEKNWTRKSL